MLKVTGLYKTYKKKTVLENVCMEIQEGEILGIVGESGCGKSTLARLLCGYEQPDRGSIFFKGDDMPRFSRRQRQVFRRSCQLVFQDNLSAFDPMLKMGASLQEVLKYNFQMDKPAMEQKVREVLQATGLREEMLDRLPGSLSGGERQRMNICRAMLMEPELMVCDEITSSLDVITQVNLLRLLKELNRNRNMTILFISHDINAVKAVSDRILIMNSGKIVEEMKKSEGFAHHSDFSRTLFHALPASHPSQRRSR